MKGIIFMCHSNCGRLNGKALCLVHLRVIYSYCVCKFHFSENLCKGERAKELPTWNIIHEFHFESTHRTLSAFVWPFSWIHTNGYVFKTPHLTREQNYVLGDGGEHELMLKKRSSWRDEEPQSDLITTLGETL